MYIDGSALKCVYSSKSLRRNITCTFLCISSPCRCIDTILFTGTLRTVGCISLHFSFWNDVFFNMFEYQINIARWADKQRHFIFIFILYTSCHSNPLNHPIWRYARSWVRKPCKSISNEQFSISCLVSALASIDMTLMTFKIGAGFNVL